jgi:parallel beta-helix repeat protein
MRATTTRRAIAAATIMLAGALTGPGAATADSGHRVVVGDGESIQAAIDAADPGTTIIVRGDHVENVWVNKDGISLVGKKGATITQPDAPTSAPCEFVDETGTLRSTTICVWPNTFDFPVPPEDALSDVEISGLTVNNPTHDAIGVFFTNDVEVSRNTVINPGCDGAFLLFVDGFQVERNVVSGSQSCAGIAVAASSNGEVSRNVSNDNKFNGIAIDDSSDLTVTRNTTSGNCIGIGVANGPDPSDLSTNNITISRNTANGNNTVCYPFNGPDDPPEFLIPIGGTGILVAGTDNAEVTRNTTNDNDVDDSFTLTAGGIFVADFPGDEGPFGPPFAVATNTTVERNTAYGNSSVVGPVDLNLITTGNLTSVARNNCEFSTPDETWCTG